MTLAEIAAYLQTVLSDVELLGDGSIEIHRVARIETAAPGELSFIANSKYEKFLTETAASALIVPKTLPVEPLNGKAFIKVADAYTAFVFVLEKFMPRVPVHRDGVHPTAVIAPSATVHPSASIGAHCFIGERCIIGEQSVLHPNTVVLDGTRIGNGCMIYPNVVIYDGMNIGNRVVIHAGAVVGADGFGFAPQPDGTYKKIPQVGIVVIEDDVELGANVCIDRATLGETIIKRGVKIDNLVQVGHNCFVGSNTVIAAQAGLSGSTKLGENCMIGGQVGFVGHLEVANRVTFGGQSGVTKSHLKEGEFLRGSPALPLRKQLRQEALTGKLESLFERVKVLEAELASLKRQ